MTISIIVTVIAAYLIGSVNFAVIFVRAFIKRDVRELGSGNAGATNVLRNAGLLPGILTFVLDALKGFVAAYIGKVVFDYVYGITGNELTNGIIGAYACGLFCMLGHVFPFFFDFKGGKGVAICVGIFAVCSPIAIICGLAVFTGVTLISKYVSLGSVSATVTVVLLASILADKNVLLLPQIILALLMGVIIIVKHMDNIKRLLSGTESKIKIGGK